MNLASLMIELGDARAGAEAHRLGLAAARRFETTGPELWHFCECVIDDYLGGNWDEAGANAEQVLNDVSDRTHYMQPALA